MKSRHSDLEQELTESFLNIVNAFPYQENIETAFQTIIACGTDISGEAFEKYKKAVLRIAEPHQQELAQKILKSMDKIRSHPECDELIKDLLFCSMLIAKEEKEKHN